MKVGDQIIFTYIPTLAINGQDKLTIAGLAFNPVLLSVWLGPKPPTAAVKKGMLGK